MEKTHGSDHQLTLKTVRIVALAIFVMALLLYTTSVKFGFPLLTHPDESIILNNAVSMTENVTLRNENFHRPNQVSIYFFYGYLNLLSRIVYAKNAAEVFKSNPTFLYLHARLIICVLGALIPVLAWKIGNVLKQPVLGGFFAFLTLFYPPFSQHSVYLAPDIPLTLFAFLTVFLGLRFLTDGNKKWLILASVVSAISFLEKYPGIISASVVIICLVLHYSKDRKTSLKQKVKPFIKDALLMLACFLIVSAILGLNLLGNLDKVIAGLKTEARTTHAGFDGLDFFGNLLFYAKEFIRHSNLLIWLAVPIGVYALIKRKESKSLVFLVGILYWVLLSTLGLHWERWSLPMMVTPLFIAAAGFDYAITLLWKKRLTRIGLIILLILGLGFYALKGVGEALRLAWPDTRVSALNYLKEQQIQRDQCLYEGYTPFLPGQPMTFQDQDIERLLAEKDYIITSNYMYFRYYNEPERYADIIAIYERFRQDHTLIQKYEPDMRYNTFEDYARKIWQYAKWMFTGFKDTHVTSGPIIEIYKIRK